MKSERQELAERLAQVIIDTGMTRPFGGHVTKSKSSTYDVMFSMPRTMDGLVRVYSPNFILIMCAGEASPGGGRWREVYTTEQDAEDFLRAIADGKKSVAQHVPTKETQARGMDPPRKFTINFPTTGE